MFREARGSFGESNAKASVTTTPPGENLISYIHINLEDSVTKSSIVKLFAQFVQLNGGYSMDWTLQL